VDVIRRDDRAFFGNDFRFVFALPCDGSGVLSFSISRRLIGVLGLSDARFPFVRVAHAWELKHLECSLGLHASRWSVHVPVVDEDDEVALVLCRGRELPRESNHLSVVFTSFPSA
jgi:hypothetical protein